MTHLNLFKLKKEHKMKQKTINYLVELISGKSIDIDKYLIIKDTIIKEIGNESIKDFLSYLRFCVACEMLKYELIDTEEF